MYTTLGQLRQLIREELEQMVDNTVMETLPVTPETKFKYRDILHTPDGDMTVLSVDYQGKSYTSLNVGVQKETKISQTRIVLSNELDLQYRDDVYSFEDCTYTPAIEKTPNNWSTKGITKPALMAYLIAVSETPMSRYDLMRRVAFLEDKPFLPKSNTSYFAKGSMYNDPGVVTKKILMPFGKKGNEILYTLDVVGVKLANEVIQKLGKGPALEAMKH